MSAPGEKQAPAALAGSESPKEASRRGSDNGQTGASDNPNATANIQPEVTQSEDVDSTYGDEISTYSASLTESIYNYPERYGRTYHAYKEGRYSLPNDEAELDRLDVHHHLIFRAMGNKLYFAPLPESFSGRALDLATGTGIWPIEFADQHPAAVVLGNDLAPTQPQLVPPNLQFYVDDVEADWSYSGNEAFDYIHARFLAGAIADWPQLMERCFAHTKPGGWMELQDWNTYLYSQDGTLPPDSAVNQFHQIACAGREAQGYDMKPGISLEKWLKDAGFVNVTVERILLPLGPWPKDKVLKEIGTINVVQMQKAVEGICLGVLPHIPQELGKPWTWEEIQVFQAQVQKDMRNKKIHGVYDFYVAYGQKPVEAASV